MRRALAAAALLALALTSQVSAAGGERLAFLVLDATRINRAYSLTLDAVAAVRVIEIQSTFAHRAMPELAGWSWGEVLAYNAGYDDPAAQAVIQWRNSPSHWAVLTSGYTHIGCADAVSAERYWFVCLLGIPPAGPGSVPGPGPASQPNPQPIVDVMPDTAVVPLAPREYVMVVASSFLVVICLIAAAELGATERFFDHHPEIRRRYEHFRKHPPPDPHVCPRHGMKIRSGTRCWVANCDWWSPKK